MNDNPTQVPTTPEAIRAYLVSLPLAERLKALTTGRRELPALQAFLPDLPPAEIQAQFTGLSEGQTFHQATTFLDLVQSYAKSRGLIFGGQEQRVLDFGCGWGRITQLLSLNFEARQICAVDVQQSALDLCASLRVGADYLHVRPWPPARLLDNSLDYILAYSVFSHLSEDCADAWIREFSRVLKPGGIVALTTRHRSFFNYLDSLRASQDIKTFARGASKAFTDRAECEAAYDRGEFCFDPLGGGGPGLTVTYGEAVIPFAYAKAAWAPFFRELSYHDPIPEGLLDQATLIFTK